MHWYALSDPAILRELGDSLRQVRLRRNQSQLLNGIMAITKGPYTVVR